MKQDYYRTTILIPDALNRELDRLAVQTDVPKAAIVRQAVQAFVDQDTNAANLRRIAWATESCQAALDHILSISAPEKRAEISADVTARMERYHAPR